MEAGLGMLRLAPETFWKMTPRELAYACGAAGGGREGAPARADLDALMRAYPDS